MTKKPLNLTPAIDAVYQALSWCAVQTSTARHLHAAIGHFIRNQADLGMQECYAALREVPAPGPNSAKNNHAHDRITNAIKLAGGKP